MKQKAYFLRNLHGMNRYKAMRTLANDLKLLIGSRYNRILAIHGYNQGHVLRDYIRSPYGLSNDIKKILNGGKLKIIPIQKGATIIIPNKEVAY